MNYKILIYLIYLLPFCLLSCDKNDPPIIPPSGNNWLIPLEDITTGADKDIIRSIDEPSFTQASALETLPDDDLVLGLHIDGTYVAYPHTVLYEHELINDVINGVPITISYSPFTGTALAWRREIDGNITEFGSSGMLYLANIMPYDRATNSTWSQIRRKCVNGALIGKNMRTIPLVELSWKNWRELYPNSMVHDYNTGFNLLYGPYPFLNYRTDNTFFIFPVPFEDQRLESKEKVYFIDYKLKTKAFPYSLLSSDGNDFFEDTINGEPYVIVGNATQQFMKAYKPMTTEGIAVKLSVIEQGDNILKDEEGSEYNIFGLAVNGPNEGYQLKGFDDFTGFWFAISNFFPNTEIFEKP